MGDYKPDVVESSKKVVSDEEESKITGPGIVTTPDDDGDGIGAIDDIDTAEL